ncbi:MAG TPA: flagellar brake protein [Clostridiales bacterium]|nr:flagellar brake protein [Clostridiales bacterium]
MLREVLNYGDKINIKPLDESGHEVRNARTFVSQLIDFVDLDIISIADPIVYGRTLVLKVGAYYNLCFYTGKGLYQGNCIVLSNHKENNMLFSNVRIITDLEKVQRRQYYRFECIHEIDYRRVTLDEELLDRKLKADEFVSDKEREECKQRLSQFDKDWIRADIIDISGGGAKFYSKSLHQPGDKLRIRIEVQVGSRVIKMELGAKIVASYKIENRAGFYEHRVQFVDIRPRDRENLIRFIFEQERRLRRKEKER